MCVLLKRLYCFIGCSFYYAKNFTRLTTFVIRLFKKSSGLVILFNYQGSLWFFFTVSTTAHIIYHSRLRLSSTFFNFFNSLFLIILNCFCYCYNYHYCFWIVFVVSVLFSATLTIIPPFKEFVNKFFHFFAAWKQQRNNIFAFIPKHKKAGTDSFSSIPALKPRYPLDNTSFFGCQLFRFRNKISFLIFSLFLIRFVFTI